VTLYVQEAITSPNYNQHLTGQVATYKMPSDQGILLDTSVLGNKIYRFAASEQDMVTEYSQINLCTDYYVSLRILYPLTHS
jgi:hypothetical protein